MSRERRKTMKKFWKWATNRIRDQAGEETEERALFLNGAIASESWFDDDVTPAIFKDELNSGKGNITVWINSPGGDCFAAAQIYNMLRDYKGHVTVKIDSLAASAASVIAMAGDDVLISPTGMLMIHNPSTVAMGDHGDLEKAIDMLNEVKNSIINAYQAKTGLSRNKLSKLMEDETWMDANKAVEYGFADDVIQRSDPAGITIGKEDPDKEDDPDEDKPDEEEPDKQEEEEPDKKRKPDDPEKEDHTDGFLFASHPFELAVTNQLIDYAKKHAPEVPEADTRIMAAKCYQRLKSIKDAF
jgi:ATP-dependent Clp protease protease subunit